MNRIAKAYHQNRYLHDLRHTAHHVGMSKAFARASVNHREGPNGPLSKMSDHHAALAMKAGMQADKHARALGSQSGVQMNTAKYGAGSNIQSRLD